MKRIMMALLLLGGCGEGEESMGEGGSSGVAETGHVQEGSSTGDGACVWDDIPTVQDIIDEKALDCSDNMESWQTYLDTGEISISHYCYDLIGSPQAEYCLRQRVYNCMWDGNPPTQSDYWNMQYDCETQECREFYREIGSNLADVLVECFNIGGAYSDPIDWPECQLTDMADYLSARSAAEAADPDC